MHAWTHWTFSTFPPYLTLLWLACATRPRTGSCRGKLKKCVASHLFRVFQGVEFNVCTLCLEQKKSFPSTLTNNQLSAREITWARKWLRNRELPYSQLLNSSCWKISAASSATLLKNDVCTQGYSEGSWFVVCRSEGILDHDFSFIGWDCFNFRCCLPRAGENVQRQNFPDQSRRRFAANRRGLTLPWSHLGAPPKPTQALL